MTTTLRFFGNDGLYAEAYMMDGSWRIDYVRWLGGQERSVATSEYQGHEPLPRRADATTAIEKIARRTMRRLAKERS